jgi:hypothetical protein
MPLWRPAAVSRQDYVRSAGKPEYVRALAANPPGGGPNPNLLDFLNSGGLLRKGVCWWHSRFTRNALYLVYFEPEASLPAPGEALSIAYSIMRASRVVRIPGYSCLADFSRDHRAVIQRMLERWQLYDGILRFAWVNGLLGASSLPPGSLAVIMDGIRKDLALAGIMYVKFQTPGLDAHALLLTGVEEIPGDKLLVSYLDSNTHGEDALEYRPGQDRLKLATGSTGVPYPQRARELEKITGVIRRFAREG